ncbi:hypothetical protein N9064_00145 [bacterium]|nr:hypothetical protein [bacterium]
MYLRVRLLIAAYLLLLDADLFIRITVILIGIVVPPEHFILGVCQLMMNKAVSRLVLLIAAILIICGQRRPQDLHGR